jgi:tRNA-specific 2-thiouridylase
MPPDPHSEQRVVVAMSGGVDSSVSAWLLARQGYEVIGLFMRNGVQLDEQEAGAKSCCSVGDARDARMVAAHLGIPFQAVDLATEFGGIIDHFVAEYARGRTPNPCALCNRDLKFDRLLDCARELGAQSLATGHYARLDVEDGRVVVRRGLDQAKDQSYTLFCVAEQHLRHALLPLGGYRKAQVRRMAEEAGLRTAAKPDSQEICFVPSNDYRALLEERGAELHPGALLDTAGKVLGRHRGTEHFTIGQRRGHGVAAREPLYVVRVDPATGSVVLGTREECSTRALETGPLNLIGVDLRPGSSLRGQVQVRHHHRAAPARVEVGETGARIEFDEPELAVAPGQGAALYQGDRLLGGGWIDSTEAPARA